MVPPAEIYESPRTKFVASFIGDTNFFEGEVSSIVNREYCRINFFGLGEFPSYNEHNLSAGDKVTVSIRPEKFRIFDKKPEAENLNMFEAQVIDIVYQGAQTRYWVRSNDGRRINIVTQHNRCYLDYKQPTWDDKVWVAWHPDDVTTLPEEAPH